MDRCAFHRDRCVSFDHVDHHHANGGLASPLAGRVVAVQDVAGVAHAALEVDGLLGQLPVDHGGLQETAEQEVLLGLASRRL